MRAAVEARDWDAILAIHAPGCRTSDRRKMVRIELDRNAHLEGLRFVFGLRSARFRDRLLATRGDRLALTHGHWEVHDSEDVGPSEVDFLQVSEVDARGAAIALVAFDPDDVDAAYAELDARYLAGEAAPYARTLEAYLGIPRAVAARNWARFAAVFAPGAVMRDNRPLGLFSLLPDQSLSPNNWVASVRVLFDVRPDTRFRLHHVLALDDRRSLTVQAWEGAESEGAFETPSIFVTSYGVEGIRQIDAFALDQLDAARACYETLAATPPSLRIENLATRLSARFQEAWATRDWAGITAGFAPDFRLTDRRSYSHLDLGLDQHLESLCIRFDMCSSRFMADVLATRGQRLALLRTRFELADGDVGPSESESLGVTEADELGRRVALVMFDPDDLDAAYAELDERYAAGEAAAYAAGWQMLRRFRQAIAARDWEQLAAVFAPDFVIEDHRPVGLMASFSRDDYVASVRTLLELRPDTRGRRSHVLALDARRSLTVLTWEGAEPDGAFEIPSACVWDIDANGVRRWHLYTLDQLDEATACYDELRPDPLRIPPNAATRTTRRNLDAVAAGDQEVVAATCAPSLVFDDRRRLIRTTGGLDMFLANSRLLGSAGQRVAHTALATAGDRLALLHVRWWTQEPLAALGMDVARDEPELEIEHLAVAEVDAEGRAVALILFDPDDRCAASTEMLDRYACSDAAQCIPAAVFEMARALSTSDVHRLRAALPDDFAVNDRRRTGIGRIENVDEYVASEAALFEQTSELAVEFLYVMAVEKHGLLAMAHTFGTLLDGGEYEMVYVLLTQFQGDWCVRMELFEPEDLDVARTRFEELRPKTSPSASPGRRDAGEPS